MIDPQIVLSGLSIRLDPLDARHIAELTQLADAVKADPSLYRWSGAPQGAENVNRYMRKALSLRARGSAVPFVIVQYTDGAIIGSTRFWNIEYWDRTDGSVDEDHSGDACEIGTWLARSAIRTAINTETKLLMLTHAFEVWRMRRVCFHVDARNERSRTAMLRLGAQFEGILRFDRLDPDLHPRNSARYSIVASEWPEAKQRLRCRLQRGSPEHIFRGGP